MRVAIFGGSFDPPHIAHVLSAHYVLSLGEVSKVLVVPVHQHAFEKDLSPFSLRVEMCKAAFRGSDSIVVSEIEETLPPPNYTLNTLHALMERYPGDTFRLMLGADILPETKNWHRFDELSRLAPPLVLGRAGVDCPEAPQALLPEVSSSEARAWFREPITETDLQQQIVLIPAAVREVIAREGLYR